MPDTAVLSRTTEQGFFAIPLIKLARPLAQDLHLAESSRERAVQCKLLGFLTALGQRLRRLSILVAGNGQADIGQGRKTETDAEDFLIFTRVIGYETEIETDAGFRRHFIRGAGTEVGGDVGDLGFFGFFGSTPACRGGAFRNECMRVSPEITSYIN